VNTETVARVLAALAENDGLLTVTAADKEGIGRATLRRAADEGIIRRSTRGKYTDPATPTRELLFRGSQLGGDGMLSHRGAAYWWTLDAVDELILEWSVPHSTRRTGPLVHRRRRFAELDFVERNGVVVTSVLQTLADVGAVCDPDIVERMLESALRKGLTTDAEARDFATSRIRSRHGGPTLRAVLARRLPGERPTGSDIETICLQVYRRAGLRPRRQWEVRDPRDQLLGFGDFGFPPKAFISEIDGLRTHDLENRQYDYNRQGLIEDLGYTFRRFTREDVVWRPRYLCDATRRGIAIARYL
jgi:very-short-patch-repair endonuclease